MESPHTSLHLSSFSSSSSSCSPCASCSSPERRKLPPLRCTYTIGDRVCDLEGYRGTVRYIGLVQGYSRRTRKGPQTHPSSLLDAVDTSNEQKVDSRESRKPPLLSKSTEGKEEEKQDNSSRDSSGSLSHEGNEGEKTAEMKSIQGNIGKEEEKEEGDKTREEEEEEEEDLWIGIEWDDSSNRGKHDGSINGKRYFYCSSHMKQQEKKKKNEERDHKEEEEEKKKEIRGGSFVKRHKLIEPKSFKWAVLERYTTKLTQEQVDEMLLINPQTGKKKNVEFVGREEAEKYFGNLHLLNAMTFSSSHAIRSAGPPPYLYLPKLRMLSLVDSLIRDWGDLLSILRSTPHLQSLCLSGTRLDASTLPPSFLSRRLSSKERDAKCPGQEEKEKEEERERKGDEEEMKRDVRLLDLEELVLDETYITYQELVFLTGLAPKVERLSLRANSLDPTSLPFFLPSSHLGTDDQEKEDEKVAEVEDESREERRKEGDQEAEGNTEESTTLRGRGSERTPSSSSVKDKSTNERDEEEEEKRKKETCRSSTLLFARLTWLDISENEISSWMSCLSTFMYFPHLDTLCMLNNRLPGVCTAKQPPPPPLPDQLPLLHAEAEEREKSISRTEEENLDLDRNVDGGRSTPRGIAEDEKKKKEKEKHEQTGEEEEKITSEDLWGCISSSLSEERRNKVIELCLEENQIDTWETAIFLSKCFPKIERLMLQGNPFLLSSSSSSIARGGFGASSPQRQVLISLFPELRVLNGGTISKADRRSAERYTLSLLHRIKLRCTYTEGQGDSLPISRDLFNVLYQESHVCSSSLLLDFISS
ncbi:cap-gly domain-containing protein [Cystoisospora suis]|uniref:Cap-gly domain-containing protein n=1 Tax=Cystoisospora suis TaxID=483139 RepID=A0A2C6KHB5_9APIC|nr:cap-gly domain-containing protein [Cystoisospora suis]